MCATDLQAEIVETTLFVSWFRSLRVRSRISVLHVIILLSTQILKVGSRISEWSRFCFSCLIFYVAPSRITRPGATRNKKNTISVYKPYTLVGPTVIRPVQDPLAAYHLYNQLSVHVGTSFFSQISIISFTHFASKGIKMPVWGKIWLFFD